MLATLKHFQTLRGQVAEIQMKIRLLDAKLHQFPERADIIEREIGFLENELNNVLQSIDFASQVLDTAA